MISFIFFCRVLAPGWGLFYEIFLSKMLIKKLLDRVLMVIRLIIKLVICGNSLFFVVSLSDRRRRAKFSDCILFVQNFGKYDKA